MTKAWRITLKGGSPLNAYHLNSGSILNAKTHSSSTILRSIQAKNIPIPAVRMRRNHCPDEIGLAVRIN